MAEILYTGYQDIKRISPGYQEYQLDIKDISRIARIAAGYQPDIKGISRISGDISWISSPLVHRILGVITP